MVNKIERPLSEWPYKLNDNLSRLERFGALYDGGEQFYAADIAKVLRLMFHKGKSSVPLIQNLQIDASDLDMADTPLSLANGNPLIKTAPAAGMARCGVSLDAPGQPVESWHPWGQPPHRWFAIKFPGWWNDTLFHDESRGPVTRHALVSWVADQDDGAHIDATLHPDYFGISRGNSYLLAQVIIEGDAVTDPTAPIAPERITRVRRTGGLSMVHAIVRQIAYEVAASKDAFVTAAKNITPAA
jgi:hypothetical protein